jgi:hypothetical protein
MRTKNDIKAVKQICLSSLVLAAVLTGATGQPARKDFNPATIYYQAFLAAPDLAQADRNYLYESDWRRQKLPERFGELMAQYDDQFRLLRRAAQATLPCDWGLDSSEGPATRLPHLARAKAVAQAARLRLLWNLQQGHQQEACDDLLAAFVLGRNLAQDGMFISTLVQIAIEAIILNGVAENFGHFSPEVLERLLKGLDAAPAHHTVAACIPAEKAYFQDWLLNKIQELRKAHPGDDAKVMEGVREDFLNLEKPDRRETSFWERINKAAGGTSEGLIQVLHGREQMYERLSPLLALAYAEYQTRRDQVVAEVEKSPNPLIASTAGFWKARAKEFSIQAYAAMVRAALEYKLHGEAGFKSVSDPCGQGPFGFRRFMFEGVDRGFELKSGYDMDGDKCVLIFVEKDGPLFYVSGPHVGEALSRRSPTEEFQRRYGITPVK